MLGKLFDRFLHEEEELVDELTNPQEKIRGFTKKDLFFSMAIFLVALAVRLYFLFNVADPQNAGDGWYGDTYHHWQIAYLTKTVGLKEGFLRLWDLKGMEFFWGPVHPLLLTLFFSLVGSSSIIIARVLSLTFGAATLVLFYLISVKYWNRWVGIGAAFLGIFNPVAIFNDASGMLEPVGYALLLGGLLLMEAAPFTAGVIWAFATMVRAEAWVFSLVLVILSLRVLKKAGAIPKLILGFTIPMVLYMKYLLDYTGNAIYPFWWNYLANAKGIWAEGFDPTFTSYQLDVRPYLLIWFGISLVLAIFVIWKKPKGTLLFSLGFITWAFLGGFFGLTHYLKGFEPWFWYIRFFVFPYLFLGFLVSYFLFYIIPKLHINLNHKIVYFGLMLPIAIIAIAIQPVWMPILSEYHKTDATWARTKRWGEETGMFYKEGKILMPEGYPSYTYSLVQYGKVEGKNILGQMFDPFYYMEGEPFDNWGEARKIVLKWLKDENVRLLLADKTIVAVGPQRIDNRRYLELIRREPELFNKVGALTNFAGLGEEILEIYEVYPDKILLDED